MTRLARALGGPLAALFATPAAAQGELYVTGNGIGPDAIYRSELDGTGPVEVVSGLTFAEDVAVDPAGGKVYWSDFQRIWRADLEDGSNVEELVHAGGNARGLAIDPAGGKIYWTQYTTGEIQRSNLDGSAHEILVDSGLNIPSHIALHLPGGKMYWSDTNDARIYRANLDGSSVEVLLEQYAYGIGIDSEEGRLFWTDGDRIWTSDLGATDPSVVVVTGHSLRGMAVDPIARKLYVAALSGARVDRVNYDGTFLETILVSLGSPHGVDLDLSECPPVVDPEVQPYGCGVNPTGGVVLQSGVPEVGGTFTVTVSNPLGRKGETFGTLLMVGFVPDPAFPCGTLVPGWGLAGPTDPGELLVGLEPRPLFLPGPVSQVGELPAAFPLDVPHKCALMGQSIYLQGLLFDSSPGGFGVGLTDALDVRLGD